MRVLLAPMEGVLDSLVRELLTEVNDYDLCITEFLRVVDQLLPVKSFYRLCPELHHQSRTPSGTRVRVQLLGQYPEWLAENTPARWRWVHGGGFKLRLSVEAGKRQRRRGNAAERSGVDLSRRESHARGGSRASAGDGESSSWLGQR